MKLSLKKVPKQRKSMKKHEKVSNIITTISFIFFIAAFMILGWVLPDKELSSSERRPLAQTPTLNWTKILAGTYMGDMEDYLLDQFPARDTFRNIMASFETEVFHKGDTNDYYRIGNGIYKLDFPMSEKNISHGAELFTKIAEEYFSTAQVYYSIIPDKNYFAGGSYPTYDYDKLQTIMEENMENGIYINIFDLLDIEDYYLTDLHWNQEKITDVAEHILLSMGNEVPNEDYETVVLTNEFYGGYGGASGLIKEGDTLSYLTNENISQLKVYDYEKNAYVSIYAEEKIEDMDPYDVFLWGARALLVIENPAQTNGKELVIFRDSFGSSMAPLLTDAYERVILIDLRYVTATYALSLVEPKSDCDVLFLYSTLLLNNSSSLRN